MAELLTGQGSLWRAAVDAARVPICITTPELDRPGPAVVYCNDAYTELLGADRRDLLGRTPRLAQGPLTDRGMLDRLRAALAAGRPFEGEMVNYRRSGRPFLLHLRIEPVQHDERVTAFVAWLRDVTEQRRNEATLSATVAIDTALHDTLRRPSTPRRDVARIARVGERCLQRLVGPLGTVRVEVRGGDANLRWPPGTGADPTPPTPTTSDAIPGGAIPGGAIPDGPVLRPLVSARGRFRGSVQVTALDAAHRDFIDLPGIDAVCLRLGSALDAVAELGQLRVTALHLQECHLPPPPLPHPRFEAVSRYQPSADTALIGGDWFDVIDTDAGPVFVIGDVMGHDVAAAADMGRLRTAMAVLIGQGMDLPAVLGEAAAFCLRQEILATALLARPGEGEVEVVTAGHPPPVLATSTGDARLVAVRPAPPLGTAAIAPFSTRTAVGDGDVVVLYTDGLVERRNESLLIGLEALRTQVGMLASLALPRLADTLVAARRDPTGADDLAVLAVRILQAGAGGVPR